MSAPKKKDRIPPPQDEKRGKCEVCQNEANLVPGTDLCAACCFGEADALAEFEE